MYIGGFLITSINERISFSFHQQILISQFLNSQINQITKNISTFFFHGMKLQFLIFPNKYIYKRKKKIKRLQSFISLFFFQKSKFCHILLILLVDFTFLFDPVSIPFLLDGFCMPKWVKYPTKNIVKQNSNFI